MLGWRVAGLVLDGRLLEAHSMKLDLLLGQAGRVALVLHRELALALRGAAQVVRVAEHVVEWHLRVDGHVLAPLLGGGAHLDRLEPTGRRPHHHPPSPPLSLSHY